MMHFKQPEMCLAGNNYSCRPIQLNGRTLVKKLSSHLFSFKILNKFILLAIILMGLYFFFTINMISSGGFAIRELKAKQKQLVNQNTALELETMTLTSYNNIAARVKDFGLVAAKEADFIAADKTQVAKK